MNVYGYSERGILNALLYEIQYAQDADALFGHFLTSSFFPLSNEKPTFGSATVLVEQSLSQFGDADAIFLVSSETARSTIFVEAKVEPSQASDWRLSKQLDEFEKGMRSRVNASNLFAQLYHKQRMVSALKSGGVAALQQGVNFPAWSSRPIRKLGNNPVVHRAVEYIQSHAANVFYLMLIPDDDMHVKEFFARTLGRSQFASLADCDVSRYGYLTWAAVKEFSEKKQLTRTLDVFTYNEGQIFKK